MNLSKIGYKEIFVELDEVSEFSGLLPHEDPSPLHIPQSSKTAFPPQKPAQSRTFPLQSHLSETILEQPH
jgi:hypothetical protein